MVDPEKQHNHEVAPQEIERKFLIDAAKLSATSLQELDHKRIIQGYLSISEDGSEVRLRQKGDVYFLTAKSGGGLVRGEAEMIVPQADFERLWPLTADRVVEKTRYIVPQGEHTIELDVFDGALDGLVLAEVEFSDEQSAEAFELPSWFGSEVTEDPLYKNQNLALRNAELTQAARIVQGPTI